MTAVDNSREMVLRADRICAASALLAETRSTAPRLGKADIAQSHRDSKRSLSMEEQQTLFSNPRLRADCRRLRIQNSVTGFPRWISDLNANGSFLL
jgi:hypothetical protein